MKSLSKHQKTKKWKLYKNLYSNLWLLVLYKSIISWQYSISVIHTDLPPRPDLNIKIAINCPYKSTPAIILHSIAVIIYMYYILLYINSFTTNYKETSFLKLNVIYVCLYCLLRNEIAFNDLFQNTTAKNCIHNLFILTY